MIRRRAFASVIVATALPMALAACSSQPAAPTSRQAALVRERQPPQADAAVVDEPWSFHGRAGRVIQTPHYRIHLTQTEPWLLGRLPAFSEAALRHYRSLVTREPLPGFPPGAEPMHTYVFRTRAEWERFTTQLLADNAAPFLSIPRGGYAWAGTSVMYDLGSSDRAGGTTWAAAGHEGWHQFTQRTFRQALPTWLEEGIATLCEGQRWTGRGVEFDHTDNPERAGRLRVVWTAGRMKSVERLVLETPADLLAAAATAAGPGAAARGEASAALDWYAQIWGLTRFLKDRHPDALDGCVTAAASGRLRDGVLSVLGPERARGLAMAPGLAVLEAYFVNESGDLAALEDAYRRYVAALVFEPGAAPGAGAGPDPR